jgi:methylglyoxal synthase
MYPKINEEKHSLHKKTIALVAHDTQKNKLLDWCHVHQRVLSHHRLCSTASTGALLEIKLGFHVHKFKSGPLGGDQQIGAGIVEGKVDCLIFFIDPLSSHPHDVDVKALMRIAIVYDVPIAINAATADFIIVSNLMRTKRVYLVQKSGI